MIQRVLSFLKGNKVTTQEEGVTHSDESLPKRHLHRADNPIDGESEDALGRATYVRSFCANVLQLNASEGLVVGVVGPWGSGKTSFINIARQQFERESVLVVDFNPWMFSGTEQLIQSFFSELAAQLKTKPALADIGESIEHYGELFSNFSWLPLVGPWIEGSSKISKALSSTLQRKKEGVSGQKARLNKALSKLDKPIIVVLDDIDRLSTAEIRDVFRLVRLTANFPNLIYLLAFDRLRVETALSEEGFPGRAYLEKILQISFDLPVIPEAVFNQQISASLEEALSHVENAGALDLDRWPDIYMEIIRPLITNMRDVRRYVTAVAWTVRDIGDQITLVDLLGMEAIRTFLPDVFNRIPAAVNALTKISGHGDRDRSEDSETKKQLEELIAAGDVNSSVVFSMIERMFFAAQRHVGRASYGYEWTRGWLRNRQVAHIDILRLYLERVAGESLLAFTVAQHAWSIMANHQEFEAFLSGIPETQIVDVISRLEVYEDEISSDRVLPGVIVLLNMMPSLPETDRGMFTIGTRMTVSRVVYRLIRSQNSEEFVISIVRSALPLIRSMHAKLMLIEMVGHSESVGHKLVPQEEAQAFALTWRDELRNLSADCLAKEAELLSSLLKLRRESLADEPSFHLPDDPLVTLALLRSSRRESTSQAFGTRAVKKTPRLAWDLLTEIVGGEEILRQRIDAVKSLQYSDMGDILELADRYLSGWRPREFGE